MLCDAQIFDELGQVHRPGGDKDAVAPAQHKAAVRDGDLALAQHRAHQHLDLGDLVELVQGNAVQAAALVDAQAHDLDPALGKAVAPDEAGKLQQVKDLARGRKLRVDGERKAQFLAHDVQLLGIFGVAHPSDGVDAGVQLFGCKAAQQIDLVGAGGGDQQLGLVHLGLPQRFQGGRVALHRHYVVEVHVGLQYVGVGIDDGHVVALVQQLPGEGDAHLAVAGDNDLHAWHSLFFVMGKRAPRPAQNTARPAAPRDLRRALTYTITAQRKRSK